MSRHLIRSLVGATALALVAGAAVAPAADATSARAASAATASSATAWKLSYRFMVGSVDYAMRGKIAGVPGNAHSGQVWFDISDDEDDGVLNDWNCPAGVLPPPYYGGPGDPSNPPTTCRIVRSLSADSGHALPYTDKALTRAHDVSRHALSDNATGVYLGRSVWSNYVLHGVGAITATVSVGGDPVTKTIYATRAARPSGHFGWISFDDPRLHVVSSGLIGDWEYNRA